MVYRYRFYSFLISTRDYTWMSIKWLIENITNVKEFCLNNGKYKFEPAEMGSNYRK